MKVMRVLLDCAGSKAVMADGVLMVASAVQVGSSGSWS